MLKWLGGTSSNHADNGSDSGMTHIGKVFNVNEYQVVVEELIAEGGFAVVYRARSSGGHIYALKRMAVNNEQDLYLAKQEIAITKALSDCPNSVTFISSAVRSLSADVHEVLILLQLYTGQSVIDLLNSRLSKQSVLSEREVMKIFSDVVVAVGRLHHRTKPIIHRDLKIENILSDSRGNYVLCDYGSCTVRPMHPETMGAAQCEDEISRFTTLAYRSPEMVSLYSGKTVSTKADIWALGCMLYKLCFMTTPFGEQALAIVSGQFSIPENSTYPEELHSLIRYMLEPDPDQRPTIWQVNEVVCRMQGRTNTLPNVFRSPKPPAVLPRAKKSDEKKTASPSATIHSTPASAKLKAPVTITTTTISSRERPKPRGFHSLSGSNVAAAPERSATPPVQRRSANRANAGVSNYSNSLGVQRQIAHTKSWDSGLDEFGAVPFNAPTQQVSSSSSPNGDVCFTDVRRDLFGSTPFTSTSRSNQQTFRTNTSSNTDEFGAPPFVCNVSSMI